MNRYSYAIRYVYDFDPTKDAGREEQAYFLTSKGQRKKSINRLSMFVKAGDRVPYGKTQKLTSYSADDYQKKACISIYKCINQDIQYDDEDGAQFIGKLVLHIKLLEKSSLQQHTSILWL